MRRTADATMHIYEDMGIGRFFSIGRRLFLKTRKFRHKTESALFQDVAEVSSLSEFGQHIHEKSS